MPNSHVLRDSIFLLGMILVPVIPSAAPLSMHKAVNTCNKQVVLDFLKTAPNPKNYYFLPDPKSKQLPLYDAANCDLDFVRFLLEQSKGIEVNEKNIYNKTALHRACSLQYNKKSLELAKLLVEFGADINLPDQHGYTPLNLTLILGGNIDLAWYLINQGADVNIKANEGTTTLMGAAKSHSPELITYLLNKGFDINAQNEEGKTPLIYALGNDYTRNHIPVIRLLLKAGADVNIKTKTGFTALHTAAIENNDSINPKAAQLLIDAGAKVNVASSASGATPLHEAVMTNNAITAEILLKNGADTGARNNKGWTPLAMIMDGLKERYSVPARMVKLLVENGADINTKGFTGKTILNHLAEISGDALEYHYATVSPEIISAAKTELYTLARWVISRGAEVNTRSSGYNGPERVIGYITPLHWTILNDDLEFTALLIENGADINVKTKGGLTPLALALRNRDKSIAKLLKLKGAQAE